jgi:predicted dehydrogenase
MSHPASRLIERLGRRLRLGMVGGGADSVIGGTHRLAFRVDGLYELVAGAMSIDPEIALATGRADLLDAQRTYTDFVEMARREAEREDGVEVVVIATPPQTHLEIAETFLAQGIDVICEKPITRTAAEAERLAERVAASGRLLLLTHCYTGYPMVREACVLVRDGALGEVKLVEGEFASGERGVAVEPDDPAQRHWRFRRGSMGKAVVLGEVGTHVHNLASYVTGQQVTSVSALLETVAARREIYDNGYLTVQFDGGVSGRLWSSFVAAGNQHGLALRVFGADAGISWRQEEPEVLVLRTIDGETRILSRDQRGLSDASQAATRVRLGHPEGYLLAFANLYRDFAAALAARALGDDPTPYLAELPDVHDGVATLRLLEAAERSHDAHGAWEAVESAASRAGGR